MKKTLLIITLGIMVNLNVFAQGYPVIDITGIITAIENGYTMVKQLYATYDNIKTSYDQLQQQIKSFESFDISTLDARDPLGSWRSINTYADRMLTYEQNIQAILNRKDIKIGNGAYSLSDIFTTPPNQTAQSMITDGWNSVTALIDPLEMKLTQEIRAEFQQKYGMAYGYYMRFNHLGEELQKKTAEVVGYSGTLRENLAEDRSRLGHIVENLLDAASTVQQQQMGNAMTAIMAQDIKTQTEMLSNIADQFALSLAQAQIEKQALLNEININSLGIPEGLSKMFDEMPSLNTFK